MVISPIHYCRKGLDCCFGHSMFEGPLLKTSRGRLSDQGWYEALMPGSPFLKTWNGQSSSRGRRQRKKSMGLTLIEVLIALAIVGIALTAVLKATSENLRSRSYLQNKTIAMWVSERIINEVRAGVIKLQIGQELKDKSNVGGRDWYWQASLDETGNGRIQKINVQVFAKEDEEAAPILTLEGYLYREE